MKRFINRHLIAVSVLCTALFATSYARPLTFQQYFTASLPTDEVADLYQDSEGFMWIVTYNGLVRYDGYDTVTYTRLSNQDDSFEGWLHVMAEGHDGKLYIGTERGILTLDKSNNYLEKLDDVMTADLNVTDIVVDSIGRVWTGGDKGIFRSDASGKFSNVDLSRTNTGRALTDIIDLLIDDRGNLWITSWHRGLYRYDLKTGKLFHYVDGDLRSAYVLHYDSGTLWIGTWGDGLLKADISQITDSELPYEVYKHRKYDSDSILDNIIYDIDQDPDGNVWVGSRSGLSILKDKEKGKFLNCYPEEGYGNLPYNEVNSILVTKDESIWLGMMGGGVCKVGLKYNDDYTRMDMETVSSSYKTSTVKSIYQIDSSSYWMGIAGHGMIRYGRNDDSFVHYMNLPNFKGMRRTSVVEAIIRRSCTGEICFGSYNDGLWLHNPQTGATWAVNSTTRKDMLNDCIHCLEEDANANLWIGTSMGVYILDGGNEIFTLPTFLAQKGDNPSYLVNDISVDRNSDFVYLATRYDGIVRIDTYSGEVKSYYGGHSDKVRNFNCVLADSDGTVWAGSAWYGLYRLDVESDTFECMDNFRFLVNQGIDNIVEGPQGKIWVTTNNTVASFHTDADEYELDLYRTMSSENGTVSFNRNTGLYVEDEGMMLFGSSRGVLYFPCDGRADEEPGPEVKITGVSLENNNLRISYSLFNYVDPSADMYKWRLVKKGDKADEQHWNTVNGCENEAVFNSLAPGRYVFEVCGKRPSGSYGEIRTENIRIMSDPWTSWWAVTLYLLTVIVLAAAVVFVYLRYRRLNEQFVRYKRETEENQPQILPLNDGIIPLESKVLCTDTNRQLVFEVKDIEYTPVNKKFLQKAMDIVNAHISDSEFRQSDFAEAMAVSKTILTEKLKNLTGLTPSAFLLNTRLTLAYKLLMEENDITRVSDLAYTVGFSDAKYFSKKFKAKYGKTPREIINERKES